MTRGLFASVGINKNVTTVSISPPSSSSKDVCVIDLYSLAPRFFNLGVRAGADQITHMLSTLQRWFPRMIIGEEGTIKPGKEVRSPSGGVVSKQGYTSGDFSIVSSRYMASRLALADMLMARGPLSDGCANVEVILSGGDGEDAAWVGAEGELARLEERGRRGKLTDLPQQPGVMLLTVPPIDPSEPHLSPDDARRLVDELQAEEKGPTPDIFAVKDEGPESSVANVYFFMLDGEFLNGPFDEVTQRWWVDGNNLICEQVNVPQAIIDAGRHVRQKFNTWYPGAKDAVKFKTFTSTPLKDAAILAFDPSCLTDEFCVDVAMSVEALAGDFGAMFSDGSRVGETTLARLGVLSCGDYRRWQQLAAETTTWAAPRAFFLSFVRHLVHPGASPPQDVFTENLDADGRSSTPYSLWVNPRPHAKRILKGVVKALDPVCCRELDLNHPDSSASQQALWSLLATELGVLPSRGWNVSEYPLPITDDTPSIAGSARPGTGRVFPLLGSNFTDDHWRMLGITSAFRETHGELTFPTGRGAWLSYGAMKEVSLEAEERQAVEDELDVAWDEHARRDDEAGKGYYLSETAIANIAAAKQRQSAIWREEREARWTRLVDVFITHAAEVNPDLPLAHDLSFVHMGMWSLGLVNSVGNLLAKVQPVFKIDKEVDDLAELGPEELALLFQNGAFSPYDMDVFTRHHAFTSLIRRVLLSVCSEVGIKILDDKHKRIETIINSGFKLLLKPSVLRIIMAMPVHRIDKDAEGMEKVKSTPTWFGVRKLIEFAVEARDANAFDLDSQGLEALASPLQDWYHFSTKRATQKPHVLAALHGIGFATRKALWSALVPRLGQSDRAQVALDFFRSLPDHTWIEHRDIKKRCTWIQGGTLAQASEIALTAALSASVGEEDIDDLDDDERASILGGVVVYCVDPRSGFGRDEKRRLWWKALGGQTGDLLEEEIARDVAKANAIKNEEMNELMARLQSWPDEHYLRQSDLEAIGFKINHDGMLKHRKARGNNEKLFILVTDPLLERAGLERHEEDAVRALLGGHYEVVHPPRKGGNYERLLWHSNDLATYPKSLRAPAKLRERATKKHEREETETNYPSGRKSSRLSDAKNYREVDEDADF